MGTGWGVDACRDRPGRSGRPRPRRTPVGPRRTSPVRAAHPRPEAPGEPVINPARPRRPSAGGLSPARRGRYERAVSLLLDAGFGRAVVMPLIVALDNLVLGSALDLAAPEAMWELTDRIPTPHLAEALAAVGEGRAD